MWALLNILFLIILCGVFLAVFVAAWSLVTIFLPLKPKRKLLAWLLCFPTYFVLLFGYFWYQTRPSVTFRNTFDFEPPADVSDIRSKQWMLGDSGHVYLRFKAAPATIQRIVARGLAPADGQGYLAHHFPDPPDWWQPPTQGVGNQYQGEFTGRTFASEVELLQYNPTSGEAYFWFQGID